MTSIAATIANELQVRDSQVEQALTLLAEGNTVPFIARYRKEATGGLDDAQLRYIEERNTYLVELAERKQAVLESIEAQGKLTDALKREILAADAKARVEDLYLPYKKRRKTKADIAREAGLEALEQQLIDDPSASPEALAQAHLSEGFPDAKSALEGARAILVDRFATDADLVGEVRDRVYAQGTMRSAVVEGKEREGAKFADYFEFSEPFAKLPSHRILALLRGEAEGVLTIDMDPGEEAVYEGMIAERFDLPVHVHTHDTAGGQLATYLAAANAGADVVDVASAPLAGTTSQPSMSALVAAFANTERDTGIDLQAVFDMEPYWEAVRQVYAPFESGIPGPTGRVYKHEIPGGQLSNLRTQAKALGLEDRFELIEDYYAGVNEILGRPTKVTPSSKVVGDLALQLVGQGVSPEEFAENPRKYDIPESVIGFLQGELGTPPGGWPLLRDKALENRSEVDHTVQVPDELAGDLASDDHATRRAALDQLLFPKQYAEYQEHLRTYGVTDQLGDKAFFYGLEEGEETMIWYGEIDENRPPLVVSLDAVSEPDEKGMRQVILTVNGQVRPITVRDESAESSVAEVEKADSSNPGHVAAPFAGAVTVTVKEGDEVAEGDPVASIEAMKMEAAISATKDGKVERVAFTQPTKVEGGDLVVVIA